MAARRARQVVRRVAPLVRRARPQRSTARVPGDRARGAGERRRGAGLVRRARSAARRTHRQRVRLDLGRARGRHRRCCPRARRPHCPRRRPASAPGPCSSPAGSRPRPATWCWPRRTSTVPVRIAADLADDVLVADVERHQAFLSIQQGRADAVLASSAASLATYRRLGPAVAGRRKPAALGVRFADGRRHRRRRAARDPRRSASSQPIGDSWAMVHAEAMLGGVAQAEHRFDDAAPRSAAAADESADDGFPRSGRPAPRLAGARAAAAR